MKSTKFLMSILIKRPLLIVHSHVQLILSHSKKEKTFIYRVLPTIEPRPTKS